MRSNFLKQSSADRCGSLSVFQNYERLAGFLCFNHSVHCRPICLLGKKLGQFFSVYQPYDKVRFPWKVVSWYSQQLGLSRQNFWSVGWLQISWDSWCLQAVALFSEAALSLEIFLKNTIILRLPSCNACDSLCHWIEGTNIPPQLSFSWQAWVIKLLWENEVEPTLE